MRSALGIRRIADVHVSQVMQASDADILHLRSVLHAWRVPHFQNWPLLLRALTHPSISNWAERVLNLRKRSLAPSTLELLGDRVVGTSVALHLARAHNDQLQAHGRPSLWVRATVGNRGMALVAANIGIDSLLRWEQPLPPQAHRARIDPAGFDFATGLPCNTHVNALANAYEAVAAAIYLDSAFPAAQSFVRHSLLQHVQQVQRANMEVPQFEEMLASDLTAVLKRQLSFVTTRRRNARSPMLPVHCFEPLQCEVLDIESAVADRREHDLFYCAVALRTRDQLDQPFHERDFLCLASHFSVETARIAALEQAIDMVNGVRAPRAPADENDAALTPLQMRTSVLGEQVPTMQAHLLSDGRWLHDADYHHLATLLERVGAPGSTALNKLDAQHIRDQVQVLRQSASQPHVGWDVHDAQYDAFLGTHRSAVGSRGRQQGEPAVCPTAVSRCMSVGVDVQLNSSLARRHKAPFRDIEDAERIVQQVTEVADELTSLSVQQRSARVKAYHVVGNNAVKLWGVQSSMQDASQERVQVVTESEQRSRMSPPLQRALLGDRGLVDVEDLRVNGAYVAIGMCVDAVGCSSAMAWLSGAEQIAGKGCQR